MSRLLVFDCDGTLVDSQHLILEAMNRAFVAHALPPPDPTAVRQIVGLSLVEAIATLLPSVDVDRVRRVAESYKASFIDLREQEGELEPLFPGIRELLLALEAAGHPLAIATGKSRRGVEVVLGAHGLLGHFVSVQTADGHPSKPHPAMLEAAMAETGSGPAETILIGDTTFDMQMARAAGACGLGVAWGYHPPAALIEAGAALVVEEVDAILTFARRAA